MNFRIKTRFEEMCLEIKVKVNKPARVRVKIFDEQRPKIVLTDRYKDVKLTETFFIRMPMTADFIIVSIYDEATGNLPKEKECNVTVLDIKKTPLEKRMDVVDIRNHSVATFVDFGQRFCFNSPYLKADQTYMSDNGQMHIEYVPNIFNSQGKELTTPARISKQTGIIQVSEKNFDGFTVPMKFMILCHEFSHYHVNDNIDDETEADLNGLLIYLGLGYPRIEAYQAFLEVFINSPTEQNRKRFDTIDRFIKNFEKDKMVVNYSR